MVFKKGETGNPRGQLRYKKKFPFTKSQLEHHFHEWVQLVETGKMSDAVRLRAVKDLVEFMADRFYGKPSQALSVSADKPLAAVVNISLGESSTADIQAALPNANKVIEHQTACRLDHENQNSREVSSTEDNRVSTEPKESNDVPDWLA